jgi:site-specific DNA recombinase
METKAMTQRSLIYARVSYDDRGTEARNLKGQIEDGQEYCAERGYRIVAELAEDDRGVSGADWDLPMLNRALEMARAGEFDVLVTRELDRFARGLAKQLVIESEFKRYGVEVEYILGEYPDTPEGNLMKNVRAVIAEYERLKIEERMTRGRRKAVKKGKIILHGAGAPPYGYRLEEDGALVICEPEARIVRLIFTWYVYGDESSKRLGYKAIARKLSEMRVPTWADVHDKGYQKKRKRGEWSVSTVDLILRKEVYVGTWFYGKSDGKTGKMNPRESWIPVEVPAILSRELWARAQEKRKRNKELAKRNTRYEYLVARRVTCGQCRTKMVGKSSHGARLRYYYCPKARGLYAEQGCDARYFRTDRVDAAVWEWVKKLLLHPEILREDLEGQQAAREEANKPLIDRLAVIDDLLTDNRGQLEKLLDLYLSGEFPKEVLMERKARLEMTIEKLEKERAGLAMTLESQTLTNEHIMTIEDFARQIAGGLAKAEESFEFRRRLIDELDVRVTLIREDGQEVAYVRCLVDEGELPIEPTIPRYCI